MHAKLLAILESWGSISGGNRDPYLQQELHDQHRLTTSLAIFHCTPAHLHEHTPRTTPPSALSRTHHGIARRLLQIHHAHHYSRLDLRLLPLSRRRSPSRPQVAPASMHKPPRQPLLRNRRHLPMAPHRRIRMGHPRRLRQPLHPLRHIPLLRARHLDRRVQLHSVSVGRERARGTHCGLLCLGGRHAQ